MIKLGKISLGERCEVSGIGPAVIVYTKRKHSVAGYQGYILVRIDNEGFGWRGDSVGHLRPDDAPHLSDMGGLLWVKKDRLLREEPYDGFEVDQ